MAAVAAPETGLHALPQSTAGFVLGVDLVKHSAKYGAIVGSSAGLGAALMAAASRVSRGDRDWRSIGKAALSAVGTGAVVGVVATVVSGGAGAGVAALFGRGALTLATRAFTGTIVATLISGPVSRSMREIVDNVL